MASKCTTEDAEAAEGSSIPEISEEDLMSTFPPNGSVSACSGSGAPSAIDRIGGMTSSCGVYAGVGMSPLLANVALIDSIHGATSSGDEPSTESCMCTEESAEKMTSSTEGMVSLSEDSSGRDTYAQAHGVCHWNSASGTADVSSGGGPVQQDTLELDESDEQMNGLLGSYREISLESGQNLGIIDHSGAHLGEDTEEEVSNLSPDSGPTSPQLDDNKDLEYDSNVELCNEGVEIGRSADRMKELSKRPSSLHLAAASAGGARARSGGNTSGKRLMNTERKTHGRHHPPPLLSQSAPSQQTAMSSSAGSTESEADGFLNSLQGLPGLVSRDGELVSFVAEDLQEQIKRASPVIRLGETPSFPGSRSSTPSLYKQALTPQLAPVDPAILDDIEAQTRNIMSSVDTVLENLTGTLHSMSSLTVDCMESYHDSVCKTCDSLDINIKSMYQLMAKFEELGNLMRPVYRLSGQIKEIKRLLDLLEQVASSGGS